MAKSTARKASAEEIRQQPEYQFILAGIPVPDGLALHSSLGSNREPVEPDGMRIRAKVSKGCLGKGLLKLRQTKHPSTLVTSASSSSDRGEHVKSSSEEKTARPAQHDEAQTELVCSIYTKTRRVSFQGDATIPQIGSKSKGLETGTISILPVEKRSVSAVCVPNKDSMNGCRQGKTILQKRTVKSGNKELSFRDSALVIQINGEFLKTDAEQEIDKYAPSITSSDKRCNGDLNSDEVYSSEYTQYRNKSTSTSTTLPLRKGHTNSRRSSYCSPPSSRKNNSESKDRVSNQKGEQNKDDCLLEQILQENLKIMSESNDSPNIVSIPIGESYVQGNDSRELTSNSRNNTEVSLLTHSDLITSTSTTNELKDNNNIAYPTVKAMDTSLASASKDSEDPPESHESGERKLATASQSSLDSDKLSERSSKPAHQQLERSKSCYDAKLEKSSVYLHSRSRTFTRASQYMRGTKRGLSQLNVHYSQTNTAHNDRIIFADLLKSAHTRNGIIGQSVFTMERRLYNRRRDPSVSTTFYDRFASTKSTKASSGPRSKSASATSVKKPSRTVADKERERKKRISRKNEQIELGYTPRATTLTSPGPEFIEHMLDTCRYLRVSPDKQASLFGTSSSLRSHPASH